MMKSTGVLVAARGATQPPWLKPASPRRVICLPPKRLSSPMAATTSSASISKLWVNTPSERPVPRLSKTNMEIPSAGRSHCKFVASIEAVAPDPCTSITAELGWAPGGRTHRALSQTPLEANLVSCTCSGTFVQRPPGPPFRLNSIAFEPQTPRSADATGGSVVLQPGLAVYPDG